MAGIRAITYWRGRLTFGRRGRRLAQETRHLAPFVKLAYPDLVGAEAVVQREPLGACDRLVCRSAPPARCRAECMPPGHLSRRALRVLVGGVAR